MATSSEFEAVQAAISRALVQTTRNATELSTEDIGFHCSSNSRVKALLGERNKTLLQLTERLLRQSSDGFQNELTDMEALDTNFRSVIDVTDNLLERVDVCLDEFKGLVKRGEPSDGQDLYPPTKRPRLSRNLQDQNIVKPQLSFEDKPSNNETLPFRPLLKEKPHALISLQDSLLLEKNADGQDQFVHPYSQEIKSYEWPSRVYEKTPPIQYHPFDTTKATFVDDFEGVLRMLQELRNATEIAVDLEHHDKHSYIGLVCLMQISTREKDWIVDTLQPWRRKLQVLNEVFADPGIIKVLHGAAMDAIWLQRDLGLYLVGLFDTFHASRSLGYPRASLAYLLDRFIGYAAQKQYQTADWRARPLPVEMFDYARSDTHFLLYIFDCMRNELIERYHAGDTGYDRLQDILINSKQEALQRYEYPFYRDGIVTRGNGWCAVLVKRTLNFLPEQIAVFARLHRWRDQQARELDENPLQIMTNGALESVARFMPSDEAALFSFAHPISFVVREKAKDLVELVTIARQESNLFPNPHEILDGAERKTRRGSPEGATITAPSGTSIESADVASTRSLSSTLWGPAAPLSRSDDGQDHFVRVKGSSNPSSNTVHRVAEADIRSAPTVPSLGSTQNIMAGVNYSDKSTIDSLNSPAQQPEDNVDKVEKRSRRKAKKESYGRETKTPDWAGLVARDYDTASSMLTFQPASNSHSAAINPFGKSADAQSGLKKQYTQSSKSTTFK